MSSDVRARGPSPHVQKLPGRGAPWNGCAMDDATVVEVVRLFLADWNTYSKMPPGFSVYIKGNPNPQWTETEFGDGSRFASVPLCIDRQVNGMVSIETFGHTERDLYIVEANGRRALAPKGAAALDRYSVFTERSLAKWHKEST
jgi:hypothetical protein